MFAHVENYPGDPILSLMEEFKSDPRKHKVNLSIGLYHDAQGTVPVSDSVAAAYLRLQVRSKEASLYLPMEGLAEYCHLVQTLLLGEENLSVLSRSVTTVQTTGGAGALKTGADFLYRHFPGSRVWVSDPT